MVQSRDKIIKVLDAHTGAEVVTEQGHIDSISENPIVSTLKTIL